MAKDVISTSSENLSVLGSTLDVRMCDVDPRTEIVIYIEWPWTHNIAIQIKRKGLTKTFMMILNSAKPFGLLV